MGRRLKEFYFTIELRSLALYRVLLGCWLVWDWIIRWPDLEAFYASSGVLPVEAPLPRSGGEFHFCLLDGVRSVPMVEAAFVLGLICYLLFLAGYRTRTFQVCSFIFFTSVVSRNILIRDGSVVVVGTMLLWTLFLPMGRRFSVDAILSSPRQGAAGARTGALLSTRSEPSLAALVIVMQVGLIYFFSAGAKHGVTWRNGTALYYALSVDQFATDLGRWVAGQSLGWIRGLTWGTLVMEFAALPLILFPCGQPYLRRIMMVCLFFLHVGIATTMHLGSFSAAMVSTYSLLLLSEDWAMLGRWRIFGPIRDVADRVENSVRLWLPKLIEIDAREAAKNVAEAKRNGFGARFSTAKRVFASLAVLVLFASFTLDGFNINLSEWMGMNRIAEPGWMRACVQVPLLPQDWELFAPDPMKNDGWWVIDGELQSGERFDPLTGREPTFEKPPDLSSRFDGFWRKYLNRIWLKKNYEYRLYFGRYLTRKNHRETPEGRKLVRFDFYYIKEPTQPPGTPQPWPTERLHLWHHECYANPESMTEPNR